MTGGLKHEGKYSRLLSLAVMNTMNNLEVKGFGLAYRLQPIKESLGRN